MLNRAIVVSNQDPENQGRIRVNIAGFASDKWALPCFTPKVVTVPDVGDVVWIMFEGDNFNNPVWLGVMYTKSQLVNLNLKSVNITADATAKGVNCHSVDSVTIKASATMLYKGIKVAIDNDVVKVGNTSGKIMIARM